MLKAKLTNKEFYKISINAIYLKLQEFQEFDFKIPETRAIK